MNDGLRGLGSVLAGYILMMVLVMFLTLGLASFWPSVVDDPSAAPPMAYVIVNLLLSAFLAAISSFATVRLAPQPKRRWVAAYAGVVLIAGVAYGVASMGGQQPAWYLFALPVLGAAAIYVGGNWYAGRSAAA